MKPSERLISSRYFTDFDGRFKAKLARVIPAYQSAAGDTKVAGISAKYDCRVKAEYQKDLMGLLEEGMLLAVRNFKSSDNEPRYTLLEVSRVWPEHFGLRGLSDSSYYPMQFEVIEQSERDWATDDRSTMMIQLSTIPINYDLTFDEEAEPEFHRGFSYPIVAGTTHVLSAEMINRMYNQRIVELLDVDPAVTVREARRDPRLGLIKMFEVSETEIPIYIDFEGLVRYHFGVFSFTGGGKSNLMSNILRRILYHTEDTKVVIFDISSEYPFLLMDVLADPELPSRLIMESRIQNSGQFSRSIVKPREYENDPRVEDGLGRILDLGRVSQYVKPSAEPPTYGDFLDEIHEMRKANIDKPNYVNALDQIHEAVATHMADRELLESEEVTEEFIRFLDKAAQKAVTEFSVHTGSNVYAWATTRERTLEMLRRRKAKTAPSEGYTTEGIRQLIEGKERLVCISIADPFVIKDLVIRITRDMLNRRKREFQVKPYVLFIFDEAQEFIPDFTGSSGIDKKCSRAVETLLRQGRKYGLGGCVATQRIAYLNTNALQQLHTYLVGTLPRPYDRSVVSNTFMIDQGILEKTLEFAPGEWLLSSYIATGIENVPIFIRADNAETEVEEFLKVTEQLM